MGAPAAPVLQRFTLVSRTRSTTPARRAREGIGRGLRASLARRAGVVAVAAELCATQALTAS